MRYIAFLRAINVGGKNLIKMEDLSRVFRRSGFTNVRTYIQSGNVIFDSPEADANALAKTIAKKLLKALGHDGTVLLRTITQLENILTRNPFKRIQPTDNVMLSVTFLASEPSILPKFPLVSATENLEAIQITEGAVFIVARPKKSGRVGYPNNFVEKKLNVQATTRNWTTLIKIIAFAKQTEASPASETTKKRARAPASKHSSSVTKKKNQRTLR